MGIKIDSIACFGEEEKANEYHTSIRVGRRYTKKGVCKVSAVSYFCPSLLSHQGVEAGALRPDPRLGTHELHGLQQRRVRLVRPVAQHLWGTKRQRRRRRHALSSMSSGTGNHADAARSPLRSAPPYGDGREQDETKATASLSPSHF